MASRKRCNPFEPRFSLPSFRRYEPIFFRVLAVHGKEFQPNEKIVYSLPGSPNTHEARIRDAFYSLLDNNWETELDVQKLEAIWPRLTSAVHTDGQSNVIRTKEAVDRAVIKTKEELATPQHLTLTNPSEIELRACLVLAHYDSFQNTSFIIKELSSPLQATIHTITNKYPNAVIQPTIPDDYSEFSII